MGDIAKQCKEQLSEDYNSLLGRIARLEQQLAGARKRIQQDMYCTQRLAQISVQTGQTTGYKDCEFCRACKNSKWLAANPEVDNE